MRHLADAAGLSDYFMIDSAGIQAFHAGEVPDARSIKTAKKRGVCLKDQTARALAQDDFENFDHIYAMDHGHFTHMRNKAPDVFAEKITLFLPGQDVPDPWYGNDAGFDKVYELIDKGAAAILAALRKEHNLP